MVDKAVLDYTLVPGGQALMAAYHAWLLHRLVKHPGKTVMGFNTINRRLWVQAMSEDSGKNGVLAVQTLGNSIMASILLATTGIMLSSLIAVLMTNNGSGMPAFRQDGIVFGDHIEVELSVKYFSILLCFFIAFLMPCKHPDQHAPSSEDGEHVAGVCDGEQEEPFFVGGVLRCFLSLPMFMWIFGPISMLLCCVVFVFLLYFLDFSIDLGCLRVVRLMLE